MTLNIAGIDVVHNIDQNRFEVNLGEKQAQLIYNIRTGLFILLHTGVPAEFQGHGIAGKLAYHALEFARKEGLKVRSYCSYTTWFIENHPEFQELLG